MQETPEKSIYSKFPFLKSTPTRQENLMDIEHSGLLQTSSLGFNTFKNEYLDYDDPSISPSKSIRNSDLQELEEKIDELQERVDLSDFEIQDLQKQLADTLAALNVRNQMLDDCDVTIANLSEKVKDCQVEIDDLKNGLNGKNALLMLEKGQENTRLDCNFRMERAQFHSDLEVN
jgi:DNA repair ATPase RecN